MDAPGWLLNIMRSDPEFRDGCGESINLAVNAVADVLHTLCTEAHQEQRGDLDGPMVGSRQQMWLSHSRWRGRGVQR